MASDTTGAEGGKARLFELLRGHKFVQEDEDYWVPVEKKAAERMAAGRKAAEKKPVPEDAITEKAVTEKAVTGKGPTPPSCPAQTVSPPKPKVPDYFAADTYEEFAAAALGTFVFKADSVAKLYPEQLRHWPERKPADGKKGNSQAALPCISVSTSAFTK